MAETGTDEKLTRDRLRRALGASPGSIDTTSYSGVDFKAIVTVSVDDNTAKKEIDEYNKEIYDLKNELLLVQRKLEEYKKLHEQNQLSPLSRNEYASLQIYYGNIKKTFEQLSGYESVANKSNKRQKYKRIIELGNVHTVSISVHRDKFPVRPLGKTYASTYVRGTRTIAGSLVFTIIRESALKELLDIGLNYYNTGVKGSDGAYPEYSTILLDQLPPFDITLIGANELGDQSIMVLRGVEIVDEGQTLSIDDLITENVINYICRDFDPLRQIAEGREVLYGNVTDYQQRARQKIENISGKILQKLNPFI